MLHHARQITKITMKKSACLLALGLDATAALRVAPGTLRMQESATVEVAPPPPPLPPPLPKIKTMRVGDNTLAGDMGFDPLGLSDTPDKLAWFREAEVRHARLAMLAALGWPVSELTNFGGLLNGDGRAPSVLNGGLSGVSSVYWAGVVGLAIFAETKALDAQFGKKDSYLPGMLGFDPLGMDADWTRNAEITNGRVAMIAITAFAYEEALTRGPIFPISLFPKTTEVAAPAVVAAVAQKADGPYEWDTTRGGFFPASEIAQLKATAMAEAAAAAAAAAAEAVAPIADAVAPVADAVANAL